MKLPKGTKHTYPPSQAGQQKRSICSSRHVSLITIQKLRELGYKLPLHPSYSIELSTTAYTILGTFMSLYVRRSSTIKLILNVY